MTRPGGVWRNWSRTHAIRPQYVERPKTTDAVVRAVQSAARRGLRIKAVGSGGSSSGIAVAPGVLLELDDLQGVVRIDRERGEVTVRAGTRLRRLSRSLLRSGLALEAGGLWDRSTVGGAVSTGDPGDGGRGPSISSIVVGATLVTGAGELIEVSAEERAELLPAVALGLGALGILVEVTLRCVPAFQVRTNRRVQTLEEVLQDLPERLVLADRVRVSWMPHTELALTEVGEALARSTALPKRASASVAARIRAALAGIRDRVVAWFTHALPPIVPAANARAARRWPQGERVSDAGHTLTRRHPVRFRELAYAVPIERVAAALAALRSAVDDHDLRVDFPIEVTATPADELWMSPAYQRASATVRVREHWRTNRSETFDVFEAVMRANGGRPHLSSTHTLGETELRGLFERFEDFVAARDSLDPDGRFRNAHLDRTLGAVADTAEPL